MPQFVKGGKNVFGWPIVGNTGDIAIPKEAMTSINCNYFSCNYSRFDFKS